jgi:FixJ family two-component response regulator
MESEPTVFVVDDDEQSCKSVCALVRSMGLRAESFSSAEQFLGACPEGRPGCLVTDIRMPGMNGLDLQEEIKRRNVGLPVIVITAYARTPSTIRAIRGGAVTLLEKPYENEDLWDAIRQALARDAAGRAEQERRREIVRRMARLTQSEREVMSLMIEGLPNKTIARRLNVSIRTVENRRHTVFEKTQAGSIAELVRMTIAVNLDNRPDSGE